MKGVILDTNIIVSAFLSPFGRPAAVLQLVIQRELDIYVTTAILLEYEQVLSRSKFKEKIDQSKVRRFFDFLYDYGIKTVHKPSIIPFLDEEDRKFYDAAKKANAILVTGNKKHYPNEQFIMSPAELLLCLNDKHDESEKIVTEPDADQDLEVREPQIDYKRKYTYADYLTWDDDLRYELIEGVPYKMLTPPVQHQRICGNLLFALGTFLKDKTCKVYAALFDVRFTSDIDCNTVVHPDIIVSCDESKMDEAGCIGAPDLIIEVLSPETATRDLKLKYDLYRKSGVREYWIIDLEYNLVYTFVLKDGHYYKTPYDETDTAPVHVLEGCEINLAEVFAD